MAVERLGEGGAAPELRLNVKGAKKKRMAQIKPPKTKTKKG